MRLLRPKPKRAVARRALIEEIEKDKRSWIQHGIAALAVSVLGLGVAGSVALTGAASPNQQTGQPAASTSVSAGASLPSAFDQRALGTNRDAERTPLDGETIDPAQAAQAQKNANAKSTSTNGASKAAAEKRAKELKSDSSKTKKLAKALEQKKAVEAATGGTADGGSNGSTDATPVSSGNGKPSLPITTGYTVAARFGAVGAWARYHTGFDFACPIGTPIHAAADGVVTNAGPNGEAGWAGNYVTIKHSDGTQSLYAHMADTTVNVGQQVSGGQVIGHVGMTGRSFGPHVHFEIYPAGITPGDVYKAVNPEPWLRALGLNP